MDFNFTDPEAWSTEALADISTAATNELNRRQIIENAQAQAERNTIEYSEAIGRRLGDAWVQPTGGHDAYPNNFQVTHNNTLWVSTTPSNVWEPGVSGWRAVAVEGGVPEWIQPTGAHDAYRLGDEVRFDGEIYVSAGDYNTMSPINGNWDLKFPRIMEWKQPTGSPDAYRLDEVVSFNGKHYRTTVDWNVWEPGVHGWVEVVVPSEETPDAPPVVTEPTPTVAEFVQPTHAGDAYQIGDQVLFDGVIFESTIANNTYSPSAYPAGWKSV